MEIHEIGLKGFKIYPPHTAFSFGGVEFADGVGILPLENKSAIHYVRTLANIYHGPLMGCEIKSLKNWIESHIPRSYLFKTNEEWPALSENYLFGEDNEGAKGIGMDNPKSDAPTKLLRNSSSFSPSYSSTSVGMEDRGNGTADFGSFEGGVAFSSLHNSVRYRIFFRMNSNAEFLNRLYERQVAKQTIKDLKFSRRAPYWDFIEELNLRLVAFNPGSMNCLTSTIAAAKRPTAKVSDRYLQKLYKEELDVINNELPLTLKHSVSRKYRSELQITTAKIKQFLRGYCHLRMIEVCYGKIPNITPPIAKAIGILVFPNWEISNIKTAIDCWQMGILNTKQFERTIQSMSSRLKEGNSVPIVSVIAEITGSSYQQIDRSLWLFRNGVQHGKQ